MGRQDGVGGRRVQRKLHELLNSQFSCYFHFLKYSKECVRDPVQYFKFASLFLSREELLVPHPAAG